MCFSPSVVCDESVHFHQGTLLVDQHLVWHGYFEWNIENIKNWLCVFLKACYLFRLCWGSFICLLVSFNKLMKLGLSSWNLLHVLMDLYCRYQEILTDPSYAGQFVLMTNPHIGNTGVNFGTWKFSSFPICRLLGFEGHNF